MALVRLRNNTPSPVTLDDGRVIVAYGTVPPDNQSPDIDESKQPQASFIADGRFTVLQRGGGVVTPPTPPTDVAVRGPVSNTAGQQFVSRGDGTSYGSWVSPQAEGGGSAGAAPPAPGLLRSYAVLWRETSAQYPAQLRPVDPARRRCVVRNLGSNPIQVAMSSQPSGNFNAPSWSGAPTAQPGQEIVVSGDSRALFARPTVDGALITVGVYCEQGVR